MSLFTSRIQVAKAGRLPSEILSAIFVICDFTWNADPSEILNPYECQLTLPAVCHLWRKVALDTTILWTRVKAVNDPPYDLLELFLSRSGTAALDISVHMNRPIEDCDDESAATTTAEEVHNFIERHCAHSRWRSFRLEVNFIHAFYTLGTWFFTNTSSFPSLQSLELISTGSFSLDPYDTTLGEALHNTHLEFSEPQAQLQSLKIRGLLSPHIFGTSFHRHLTSLVHLELRFSGQDEWYDHEGNIPATRLLSKDLTSTDVIKALESPKIHVPTLTTFSFLEISSPLWVLNHLLTLDAPNVTTFELTFGKEPFKLINGGREAVRQLVSYIATSGPIGGRRKSKPLFPSLSHLTFSTPKECFKGDLEVLLAGYPQIHSLALPRCSTLQPLAKSNAELFNLKVGIKDVTELKELLVTRRKAGMPLRNVQVMLSALSKMTEPGTLKELKDLGNISLVNEAEELEDARD